MQNGYSWFHRYGHYVSICFLLHYLIYMSKNMFVLMKRCHGKYALSSPLPTQYNTVHIFYCQTRAINPVVPGHVISAMYRHLGLWVHCLWAPPSSLHFLSLALNALMDGFSFLSATFTWKNRGGWPIQSAGSTYFTVVTFYYEHFPNTCLYLGSLQSPADEKGLEVFFIIFNSLLQLLFLWYWLLVFNP